MSNELKGMNRFLGLADRIDKAGKRLLAESEDFTKGDGKLGMHLMVMANEIRSIYKEAVDDYRFAERDARIAEVKRVTAKLRAAALKSIDGDETEWDFGRLNAFSVADLEAPADLKSWAIRKAERMAEYKERIEEEDGDDKVINSYEGEIAGYNDIIAALCIYA